MPESRFHACELKEDAMSYLKRSAANCAGCLGCTLACSFEHFDYFDADKSRIRINMDEETSEIEICQCIQCPERSCVEACPVGALTINEEYGYIKHDEKICIQCQKCVKACNYKGVYIARYYRIGFQNINGGLETADTAQRKTLQTACSTNHPGEGKC